MLETDFFECCQVNWGQNKLDIINPRKWNINYRRQKFVKYSTAVALKGLMDPVLKTTQTSPNKIIHQNYVKKSQNESNKTKAKITRLRFLQKTVYILCLITLVILCAEQVCLIMHPLNFLKCTYIYSPNFGRFPLKSHKNRLKSSLLGSFPSKASGSWMTLLRAYLLFLSSH